MSDGASKIINDKQFAALVKAVDENKTKVASLNGAIGERIQHAADNAGLHPGAFKIVCKLHRIDEQKRDEFLRQFDIYREKAIKMGLFGEEHVGDIVDQAEEQTQEEADARAAEENTKRLEKGVGQLSDEEREFDDETSSRPSRRSKQKTDDEGDDEAVGTYRLQ